LLTYYEVTRSQGWEGGRGGVKRSIMNDACNMFPIIGKNWPIKGSSSTYPTI